MIKFVNDGCRKCHESECISHLKKALNRHGVVFDYIELFVLSEVVIAWHHGHRGAESEQMRVHETRPE